VVFGVCVTECGVYNVNNDEVMCTADTACTWHSSRGTCGNACEYPTRGHCEGDARCVWNTSTFEGCTSARVEFCSELTPLQCAVRPDCFWDGPLGGCVTAPHLLRTEAECLLNGFLWDEYVCVPPCGVYGNDRAGCYSNRLCMVDNNASCVVNCTAVPVSSCTTVASCAVGSNGVCTTTSCSYDNMTQCAQDPLCTVDNDRCLAHCTRLSLTACSGRRDCAVSGGHCIQSPCTTSGTNITSCVLSKCTFTRGQCSANTAQALSASSCRRIGGSWSVTLGACVPACRLLSVDECAFEASCAISDNRTCTNVCIASNEASCSSPHCSWINGSCRQSCSMLGTVACMTRDDCGATGAGCSNLQSIVPITVVPISAQKGEGGNLLVIVLSAVGGTVALALGILGAFWVWRRRQRQQQFSSDPEAAVDSSEGKVVMVDQLPPVASESIDSAVVQVLKGDTDSVLINAQSSLWPDPVKGDAMATNPLENILSQNPLVVAPPSRAAVFSAVEAFQDGETNDMRASSSKLQPLSDAEESQPSFLRTEVARRLQRRSVRLKRPSMDSVRSTSPPPSRPPPLASAPTIPPPPPPASASPRALLPTKVSAPAIPPPPPLASASPPEPTREKPSPPPFASFLGISLAPGLRGHNSVRPNDPTVFTGSPWDDDGPPAEDALRLSAARLKRTSFTASRSARKAATGTNSPPPPSGDQWTQSPFTTTAKMRKASTPSTTVVEAFVNIETPFDIEEVA